MCSPAMCYQCGKTTWSGCGMHADQVMAMVPAQQRCSCHEQHDDAAQGSQQS